MGKQTRGDTIKFQSQVEKERFIVEWEQLRKWILKLTEGKTIYLVSEEERRTGRHGI